MVVKKDIHMSSSSEALQEVPAVLHRDPRVRVPRHAGPLPAGLLVGWGPSWQVRSSSPTRQGPLAIDRASMKLALSGRQAHALTLHIHEYVERREGALPIARSIGEDPSRHCTRHCSKGAPHTVSLQPSSAQCPFFAHSPGGCSSGT
jgi:hypothetical protein